MPRTLNTISVVLHFWQQFLESLALDHKFLGTPAKP